MGANEHLSLSSGGNDVNISTSSDNGDAWTIKERKSGEFY